MLEYSQLENSVHLIIPEADVARMLKGAGLMLGGVFKSFGGVMLALGSTTVSWTGIGILGIGAGIFVTEAGIFDMSQGAEEFFLGVSGDSTTLTRNKMCDWYYDGNEGIYHLSTGVAAAAGSMLTPYVNAVYGKTAVAGATTAGSTEKPAVTVENVAEKQAVTEAAGGTTDDALEQFYDDIFESSYGEQFDPVGEQAIAGTEGIEGGLEPDFYVGLNGKALPSQYKYWIGTNMQKELLNQAENPQLQNAIRQLYRENSFIGDGGTADVIRFEQQTGLMLGRNGGSHIQKGIDMVKYIENKILTQDLSPSDRALATQLLEDLYSALGR